MLDTEINDLLQEYRYKRKVWDNKQTDWADILSKPTTISGYGITDCYTKDEIKAKTLNTEQANVSTEYLFSPFGSAIKVVDNSGLGIGLGNVFATKYESGAINAYYGLNKEIISTVLNGLEITCKTKMDSELSVFGEGYKFNLLGFVSTYKIKTSAWAEFPKLDIFNGETKEGSIEYGTYEVDNVVHDGFNITHEKGKFALWGYKNADMSVNSYMILDIDGVLRSDSDGDDWAPIRFEKQALFRNGLRIGSTADIIIGGYNLKTKIASIENAIETGTGMVQWSNVLNKPSTLSGYGITDALSLAKGQYAYAYEGSNNYNLIGMDANYGQTEIGNEERQTVIKANTGTFLTRKEITTHYGFMGVSLDSGAALYGSRLAGATDYSSYVKVGPNSLKYNNGTVDYNIYHSGNFNPCYNPSKGPVNMETGVGTKAQGLSMSSIYNYSGGFPVAYGNCLELSGEGKNQLAFEWKDGLAGSIYHRCLRNISNSWTDWRRLAYANELEYYNKTVYLSNPWVGNHIDNNYISVSSTTFTFKKTGIYKIHLEFWCHLGFSYTYYWEMVSTQHIILKEGENIGTAYIKISTANTTHEIFGLRTSDNAHCSWGNNMLEITYVKPL